MVFQVAHANERFEHRVISRNRRRRTPGGLIFLRERTPCQLLPANAGALACGRNHAVAMAQLARHDIGRARTQRLSAESLTMWPELLARALENPLRNALKYAREFIKVDWYREGREWVMTIRDDGPGVPVEQQPRLFLPFFRVDDARNAKTGGTGLGLAIAAEAIQRHGGTIRASSNQPTGLVITIRLPMP